MKQPIDSNCRMCYKAKHIVAQCATLALSEYTNRHTKVAGYIHWMICKHMGLQLTDKHYEQIRYLKGSCQWYRYYVGCTFCH